MLDARAQLVVRREMREILGITDMDTSGKSGIIANVMVKAMVLGVDDTIAWVKQVQQAGSIDAAQADRMIYSLERHSRWR